LRERIVIENCRRQFAALDIMSDKYDASASLSGYLYQCRYALLSGLEASKSTPGKAITIERFDDIAFEEDGEVKEAIQTKHHGNAGDLADTSVDLWKTIGIWLDKCDANPQLPFETRLVLLTTATAPEDSASARLRDGRASGDVEAALKILTKVASESKNKTTAPMRSRFVNTKVEILRSLVAAIYVYDKAPNIIDVRDELEELVAFSASQQHVSTLVDYLEGWWFGRVIQMLSRPTEGGTLVSTMRAKIDELREHFKADQLPLSDPLTETTEDLHKAADDRVFVRQARAVGVGEPSVKTAIRDYYRASAQRSRWARESLLLDGEASRYDAELRDRWQREFEANRERADLTTEDGKKECGRNTFHWANRSQIPFRNRSEMWLTTGSFQMLADALSVGWHPEYASIFGPGGGG
jgi:hypothetical protein